MEVLPGDAVVSAQVSLGLVPEIFDAVDVVLSIGEELRVIDPHMMEIGDVELIIGAKAVGVDDAVRLHFTGNNRDQRVRLRVLHRQDEDASATLEKSEYGNLSRCAATALSLPYPTEIAFIDLDLAGQFRRFLGEPLRDDNAQPMVELRRGDLVYADQKARRPGRRPGDEVLQQLIRLNMREF